MGANNGKAAIDKDLEQILKAFSGLCDSFKETMANFQSVPDLTQVIEAIEGVKHKLGQKERDSLQEIVNVYEIIKKSRYQSKVTITDLREALVTVLKIFDLRESDLDKGNIAIRAFMISMERLKPSLIAARDLYADAAEEIKKLSKIEVLMDFMEGKREEVLNKSEVTKETGDARILGGVIVTPVAGITGIVGACNIWNPVGWAFLALTGVIVVSGATINEAIINERKEFHVKDIKEASLKFKEMRSNLGKNSEEIKAPCDKLIKITSQAAETVQCGEMVISVDARLICIFKDRVQELHSICTKFLE